MLLRSLRTALTITKYPQQLSFHARLAGTPISSSFGSSVPNERSNFRQVGILLNDTDVLDANIDLRAQPNGKE